MILAGDIGGTNSRLALFDEQLACRYEKVCKNANRPALEPIVQEFLAGAPPELRAIDRATFAVAGPVVQGKAHLTNLSWDLDESDLGRALGVPRTALINDLQGHAEGIAVLKPEQLVTLFAGVETPGANRAIIAAGTGLGEAGLFWDNRANRHRAFAAEGGHADFSPRDEVEDALLAFLRPRCAGKDMPVNWECVLSGPGLKNVYTFFAAPGPFQKGGALPGDPTPADISAAALAGTSAAAAAAVDRFVSMYAAEAGNLCVKTLATGGVYLGGNIATTLAPKMKADSFLKDFARHGPPKLQAVLKNVPIHVINFEFNGLYGAANYARNL